MVEKVSWKRGDFYYVSFFSFRKFLKNHKNAEIKRLRGFQVSCIHTPIRMLINQLGTKKMPTDRLHFHYFHSPTSAIGSFIYIRGTSIESIEAIATTPGGRGFEGSDTQTFSWFHRHPPLLVNVLSHCSGFLKDSQITARATGTIVEMRIRQHKNNNTANFLILRKF